MKKRKERMKMMENLTALSYDLRKDVINMIRSGKAGHIGGDMSVIDTLVTLYFKQMNISPENMDDPDRDRFVMSKGHSVEALYAVLAEKGFFPIEEVIDTFSKFCSKFIGHPNNNLPGIEMNSGSLGHGLPVCVGMALAGKMNHQNYRVYKLTGGKEFRTDYSNASRTQLFHIGSLSWDQEVCSLFGIPVSCLAEVTDSDGEYGYTDFEGYFENPIPIRGVLGDSHGALFGQGCTDKGMIKTTYGTGSSIMMNIGQKPVYSDRVVTSLAWKMNGQVNYVLEGNINYTGAVITWLKDELKLISSPSETEILANKANPGDRSYLVPAFSGLGAPYWDSEASGILTGITRTTGRAEIVRAGLESIAYQITDVVNAMSEESGIKIQELRVDGGPTRNKYLMQFQSDIADVTVQVPSAEELSGIGAAYAAGIAAEIFDREKVFSQMTRTKFSPEMEPEVRNEKYHGWKKAVKQVLT